MISRTETLSLAVKSENLAAQNAAQQTLIDRVMEENSTTRRNLAAEQEIEAQKKAQADQEEKTADEQAETFRKARNTIVAAGGLFACCAVTLAFIGMKIHQRQDLVAKPVMAETKEIATPPAPSEETTLPEEVSYRSALSFLGDINHHTQPHVVERVAETEEPAVETPKDDEKIKTLIDAGSELPIDRPDAPLGWKTLNEISERTGSREVPFNLGFEKTSIVLRCVALIQGIDVQPKVRILNDPDKQSRENGVKWKNRRSHALGMYYASGSEVLAEVKRKKKSRRQSPNRSQ